MLSSHSRSDEKAFQRDFKKNATKQATGQGEVTVNLFPYRVDGEVGRFEFVTHSVSIEDEEVFNTALDLFQSLNGKEYYKTRGFKEIAMIFGCVEGSYRKTTTLINRIRYQQEDGTPCRTLKDNVELESARLNESIENKARIIFKENGFSEQGVYEGDNQEYGKVNSVSMKKEDVEKALQICQAKSGLTDPINTNPVFYEDPEMTVNISADDVNVKKQKENRKRDVIQLDSDRKYVHNTIFHIEHNGKSYTLNGKGTVSVLRLLIAILLNNDLLKYHLRFFVDGQRTLQAAIFKAFSWYKSISLILDWYHLEEKCKIQLSLALNGRVIRNKVLDEIVPLLWYGLVDKAIEHLGTIADSAIKNAKELEKLIGYFERNKPYIPCYALRKELGLRNSSNKGEKMNDLIVSERQKHNGMSWSERGSVALASLTALKRNGEYVKWFRESDIDFKLAA